MTEQNPLTMFFREPGMCIQLPTGGAFYVNGEVELTPTGELEVYPMTTNDELVLKNPDGLLNGNSMAKVIESCCPGVADMTALCSHDVDAIMLAIRAASYGDEMDVDVKCPECKADNRFGVSINYLLTTFDAHEPEYKVELSDKITVFLRPFTFRANNQTAILAFQETKYIEAVRNEEIPEEEKQKIFNDAFFKIAKLNNDLIIDAMMKIVVPTGEVTDKNHITEWVENGDIKWIKKIQKGIKEISTRGVNKTEKVKCQQCEHEWETVVGYDPSHFFG